MARRTLLAPALGTLAAAGGAALWWRHNPSACPYAQRFWVEAPHPFITRRRLLEVLEPQSGERVLEVGPGTGYYSLEVARRLGDGTLELLDLQRQMLDHVLARAGEAGAGNLVATEADARSLPFEDGRFDAAFINVTLGEIPDQQAAVDELARVVRPGGRVVFGEIALDPHYVTFGSLSRQAEQAGLTFDRRIGGAIGYFARFAR